MSMHTMAHIISKVYAISRAMGTEDIVPADHVDNAFEVEQLSRSFTS